MSAPEPRAALAIVRVASRLVPSAARAAWRREWEAELLARWSELAGRSALTAAARADLMRRALGSVVDAVFYARGRWTMRGIGYDARLVARGLARRPGLSSVIVLTLAVGIGGGTAIFGVARDVILRPFPYPDPDRVVAVQEVLLEGGQGFQGNTTYPNIFDLDQAAETFDEIGAIRWWVPALEDDRGSVVVNGATVTANFFEILGVEPGAGRYFRPDEEGEGRPDQVVISHALWTDRFGRDPGLVGSDIRLSGSPFRVIGVTSADFEDPWLLGGPGEEPAIWRTVASPPSEWPRSGRSWRGLGRVRADVSLATAREELDAIFAGLAATHPEHNAGRGVRLVPIRALVAGPARPALYTLLGAVGVLLLIACANVASLLLGRALDRRDELTLHRALGAPGWRLLHRGFLEAGLLAATGGALGLLLAAWLGRVATSLTSMLPRPVTGDVDATLVAFAVAVTSGTALLFGVAPAAQAARAEEAPLGRDASRSSTLGRGGGRLRRSVVVAELALTTALLVGTGLMLRSFQRLGAVELGLTTEGVVAVDLHGSAWWSLEPGAAQAQWDDVLASVRTLPGVEAAGAIDYLPFSGDYSCDGIRQEGQPEPAPGEVRCAEVRVVLPGSLEAMGITLLRGRLLADADGPDAPAVAVIDERMAETYWSGEDALGARFEVHRRTHEVVGIVANMRHFGPGGIVRPMVYLHAPQEGWNGVARGLSLVARGADAGSLVAPIRRAVAEVNPSIAIGGVRTLDGLLGRNLAGPRFRTQLMAAFGLTALLLAVLGIAGVMTYSVARRTRELGVRLALGARPDEVRRLVLAEGSRLVAVGIALGLLGAVTVAGALEAVLFEVSARDPWVYAGVALLLAAAATVACYLPARRASRVDPVSALASE